MPRIDDQPKLTTAQFNDRRLELARFMAKQRGWSWTGLSGDERDMYLDLAGDALRGIEARLEPLRSNEALLDAPEADAAVAEAAHDWYEAVRRLQVDTIAGKRDALFAALDHVRAPSPSDGSLVGGVVAAALAFREVVRRNGDSASEVCAARNALYAALDALYPAAAREARMRAANPDLI